MKKVNIYLEKMKLETLVKKVQLIERKGDLHLMQSRGGFDPYLYNYFNQKNFKGKEYYSLDKSI